MADERVGLRLDLEGQTEYASATQHVARLEKELAQLNSQIQRGAPGWELARQRVAAVAVELEHARTAAAKLGTSHTALATAAQSAGQQTSWFARNSSTAAMAMMNLGQLADDAQYGFRAVANQLPMLGSQLVTMAGGSMALGIALGGVVAVGATLVNQFGPAMVQWVGRLGQEFLGLGMDEEAERMERLAKATKEAAEETRKLVDEKKKEIRRTPSEEQRDLAKRVTAPIDKMGGPATLKAYQDLYASQFAAGKPGTAFRKVLDKQVEDALAGAKAGMVGGATFLQDILRLPGADKTAVFRAVNPRREAQPDPAMLAAQEAEADRVTAKIAARRKASVSSDVAHALAMAGKPVTGFDAQEALSSLDELRKAQQPGETATAKAERREAISAAYGTVARRLIEEAQTIKAADDAAQQLERMTARVTEAFRSNAITIEEYDDRMQELRQATQQLAAARRDIAKREADRELEAKLGADKAAEDARKPYDQAAVEQYSTGFGDQIGYAMKRAQMRGEGAEAVDARLSAQLQNRMLALPPEMRAAVAGEVIRRQREAMTMGQFGQLGQRDIMGARLGAEYAAADPSTAGGARRRQMLAAQAKHLGIDIDQYANATRAVPGRDFVGPPNPNDPANVVGARQMKLTEQQEKAVARFDEAVQRLIRHGIQVTL